MSAFAPTDPRDLMNRRKQLVQKLMQQYQQKVGAGRGVPAVGGHPIHAGGRAAPRPRIAGGSNVVSSLLSRLGPGGAGLPLPGEVSPGPGQAAPDHGPPQSVPIDAPPVPTGPPQGPPTDPGFNLGSAPTSAPAASAAPASTAGALVGAARPGVGASKPAAVGALTGAASKNLVPLGGGVYYDYVNDTIHGTGGFG